MIHSGAPKQGIGASIAVNHAGFANSEILGQRLADLAGLARRVAHDFDNVLTGIIGFAELSLACSDKSSPPHAYLSELLRVCENGIQLTRRLHFFHACGEVSLSPSDPASVIRAEVERLRKSLPATVELGATIETAVPLVRLDQEPVRHVLAQILTNAIESCPERGRIEIRARTTEIGDADTSSWLGALKAGRYVEIAVVDSGNGFSEEARRRLVAEPFFTTKPKHRGLGLPIAFRILHAHGGGLRFESQPGQCMVRIALPAASSQEANG